MSDVVPTPPDPFAALKAMTPARVRLGRAGQAVPTAVMLDFQLAHARARDAVYTPLDVEGVRRSIGAPSILVDSAAGDRVAYLQDPRLGRRLGLSGDALVKGDYDVALVVADGLSAAAVHAHAPAVVEGLMRRLNQWALSPVIIARQARVALGDAIGEALGARAVVILIGERPGLAAPDSLSAYLTWGPAPGRRDSERNCVSNIRQPPGLSPDAAAGAIAYLLDEARRLGFTGVALKDRRAQEDGPPANLEGDPRLLSIASG